MTPTPVVPAPQSGNSNNTSDGDVGIGISAGGASATLNSLVIVAIDVFADVNGVFPDGNAADDEWDNKSSVDSDYFDPGWFVTYQDDPVHLLACDWQW